jgi:hypothetical protein
MVPLIINSLVNDLNSRSETANCLALTLAANIGNREAAEQLAPQVSNLLFAVYVFLFPHLSPSRPCASLCL